jgi:hypothetical protein
MAEILIEYKAEATSLKAVTNEIINTNDEVVASAQKSANEVSTAYKNAGKSITAAFSGKEVKKALDEQNTAISLLTKNSGTLSTQLRQLKNELQLLEQSGKDGTSQFLQLTLEAARLEDQISDTKARVSNLASDTFKFDVAVQATQALATGFQIAQGAAALFGVQNEDLQKSLVKVNAAIAIASGLQQVSNLILDESKLKTFALIAAQKTYAFVTGASTAITNAFRAALIGLGIGAVITGITLLIERLSVSKESTEDATEATNKFAEANQRVANSLAEAANEQELAAIRLAKAQGNITDATAKRAEVEAKVNEDLRKNQLQTLTELTDARTKYNENIVAIQKKYAKDERSLIGSVQIEQRNFEEQRAQLIEAGAKRAAAIRTNSIAEIIEFENDLADKSEKANKKTQKAVTDTKKEYEALKISVGNVTEELLKQDAVITQTLAGNRVSAAEAAFSKIQLLNQQGLATAEDVSNSEIELIQQRAIAQLDASELSQREKLKGVTEGSILETEIIKAGESERQAIANAAELEIFNKKKEFREKNAAERKKDREAELEEIIQIAQQTGEIILGLLNIYKEQSQARIEQINAQSQAEIEAINNSAQSEFDKQRQREASELRTSRKIAAEKIKQAKLDRATALFEIALNTSIAVSKSIAASPQTFGLPFSAFALAQGLIQAGIVISKPLPKYAKGGIIGGRSHDAGGTLIEAERGEFIVNRNAVTRHRSELDALNTSSAAFKRLIDERYVRPALNYYMGKKERAINVNASLNSKSMEREIKGMRRDLKRNNTVININGNDSRYSWHLN